MLKTFTATDNSPAFGEEGLYVLDTTGVCHCKGFLSQDEVDYINNVLNGHVDAANPVPAKFPFFEKDAIFCKLMTKKWIVEACTKTMGRWYRLDHCFGVQQPGKIKHGQSGQWIDRGYSDGNIHGGNHTNQGSVFYQSYGSTVWSGHMTFGISLIGQNKETGGFCYIPGSHKQSTLETGGSIFNRVLKKNFDHPSIVVPTLEAGDAVLFSDNLVHGTKPLKQGLTRRALYYMFVPGFVCWRPYDQIKHYQEMATTELEKKILRPPYVATYDDSTINMSDNFYKDPTL